MNAQELLFTVNDNVSREISRIKRLTKSELHKHEINLDFTTYTTTTTLSDSSKALER